MKTALVYDRINKWGGAERVLLSLHELFPGAPLYTSVYDPVKAPWAKIFNIKTSFLQNLPLAKNNHELIPFLMPIAFEQFDFDEYDLVISVTSEAAKGIITKPRTKHICYCLTPTRYLWSGYTEYFRNSLIKMIASPVISYLKKWDVIAAQRPDHFIAISNEVKNRIEKYYHRDADVIYPAVMIEDRHKSPHNAGDYFLVVSRLSSLTPYKRIDIAIKACNELKLPLKIIGAGSALVKLKSMAGPTIDFISNISDDKLAYYYKNCKALIFPGIEDLGLVMIEAQKFGKPVIAFSGGGALEIIKEGKTGLFFDRQDKISLIRKLQIFDKYKFDSEECKKQASIFNFDNFKSQFLTLVWKLI